MAGLSYFETITIDDFKTYFSLRKAFQFNTYPLYSPTTTYNINDKVSTTLFDVYQSLQNNNIGNDVDNIQYWLVVPFIVFDEFITEGFSSAKSIISNWIANLPDADSRKKTAYLLLTAHSVKLLLDEREGLQSQNTFTSGGFIGSESANGVSLSYTRPEDFNEIDSWLNSTPFGIQYSTINKQVYKPAPVNLNPNNSYSY